MAHAEIGTVDGLLRAMEPHAALPDKSQGSTEVPYDIDPPLFDAEIGSEKYRDAFLSLFERSGIALAILDPNLRVRSVNSPEMPRCARRPDRLQGREFVDFLHPSVRQHVLYQFGRLVKGHRTRLVGHSVVLCVHGTTVSGKLTAFPVTDGAGRVEMIVVQFTPEEAPRDQEAVDGSKWRLAPLSAKVLEGVAAGDPTVRLAAKLFLSRQGIEYHVGMLLRQFQVPNRTALAARAYSMGMFGIGSWPPKVLPGYIRSDDQGADTDLGTDRRSHDRGATRAM
ncbi:helix-turn-helix transcriptional regulator [Streptomyces sp. NPDC058632]|uniref:helix-turn-helix transcriptional regulator n=1 Tax=unclassified Streptomyces TaxID=2593676 RepID=UPI0036586C4B